MNIVKHITKNKKEVIVGKNSCDFIINHHTGSKSNLKAILGFFRRPDYLSTHYIVGRYGKVVQYVEDKDIAFHAGKSFWKTRKDFNVQSIGIEIVSNGHEFTDEQREAVFKLNQYLMAKHEIPTEHVLRHSDIAGYRGKWDVGPNFYTPRWGSWGGFQKALALDEEFEKEKRGAIKWVQENKISNGERPNDMVTRAEVFVMLQRLAISRV